MVIIVWRVAKKIKDEKSKNEFVKTNEHISFLGALLQRNIRSKHLLSLSLSVRKKNLFSGGF